MAIHEWPESERPRERLLKYGAAALGDAELLALFLRVGIPGMNAVELGRHLLQHFGSLTQLCRTSLKDLSAVQGIGVAKYTQLQAVMEMARRALAEELTTLPALSSPGAVRDYLRLTLGGKPQEVFCCLFLDSSNRLIVNEELFRGTIDQAMVYPREVIRRALAHNAAGVILAHNHPGGDAHPSMADETLTNALVQGLALVDVLVIDHMIVGSDSVYSFAESGKLCTKGGEATLPPAVAPQHRSAKKTVARR